MLAPIQYNKTGKTSGIMACAGQSRAPMITGLSSRRDRNLSAAESAQPLSLTGR